MDDLIERLEAAAEGSRELSDEVLVLTPWFWEDPKGGRWGDASCPRVPDPTRSVDDALGLVPEGWKVQMFMDRKGWKVRLQQWRDPFTLVAPFEDDIGQDERRAPTLALGLCIAILRAWGET
jgi:hypothetical protein